MCITVGEPFVLEQDMDVYKLCSYNSKYKILASEYGYLSDLKLSFGARSRLNESGGYTWDEYNPNNRAFIYMGAGFKGQERIFSDRNPGFCVYKFKLTKSLIGSGLVWLSCQIPKETVVQRITDRLGVERNWLAAEQLIIDYDANKHLLEGEY